MNIDEITSRVHRGIYTAQDVNDLLAALEDAYQQLDNRTPSAKAAVEDKQASEAAKAAADAERLAEAQVAAAKEAAAADANAKLAQEVTTQQAEAVASQAAVDKFKADQATAEKILADKQQVSSTLMEQLGNVQTITPVLGPQDPQKN